MSRQTFLKVLTAWLALLSPVPAWAQSSPTGEPVSFGWALLQMLAALALVLGIMLLLYWLLRRLNPRQILGAQTGTLKLWGRLNLGSRKSLVLVEVGRKMLVLGLGDKELCLLREIDNSEEIAELKDNSGFGPGRRATGRDGDKMAGFLNILKRKQYGQND